MASSSTFDSRDGSSPLVQRHKRRGAALSCAECRRLKLKCSRVFPCSNCVKKGCGPICPDGSLTTGKGNRFVLANTEALHDKISQLSTRVRQLEDALAQSHALNSHESHPLLSEDLKQIKRPLERERLDSPPAKTEKSETDDTINAIGSLSISQDGRSTFFGTAANSWYLLKNEEGSEEEDITPRFSPPMPSDLPWLGHAFPFTSAISKSAEVVRESLINLLPRAGVAQRLCEIYYRHAAWMYHPITGEEFNESIFRPVYEQDYSQVGSHSLAVLYMVLALGTLLDLERPAHSQESTQYYELGRAALAIDSVFDTIDTAGIQALLLMCHFMFLNDIEGPRWVVMGLVVKLAQSLGLHRDSGKWNLGDEETYRRRCLLWEIYVYDSWQSLTFGRPPSFSMIHIDTKMPHEPTKNAQGEVEMSFAAWKHGFSSQCLQVVLDQAFGARPASYKTIQELDKKVRLYYLPPSLQVPGFGNVKLGSEPEQPTVELTMQRYIAFAIREISLFYMHRGFFAHALEESPTDPMGSKYAPSVLAAYSSACAFVGLVESLYKQHPQLTERMWFLFTHVFSCSIVLGSIAVKPQMALARSALSHLDSAYILFSQVTESYRTAKILPILNKLRDRARAALLHSQSAVSSDASRNRNATGNSQVKTEIDEFAALGGTTRLVSRRTSSTPSTPSRAGSAGSPASQPASPPPPASQESPLYQPLMSDWQTYPHVQNFNDFPDYTHSTQPETPPTYLPPNQSPIEMIPEYYGYQGTPALQTGYETYQVPYGNGMQNPADYGAPVPDLHASWQNFVAQYK